MRVDLLNAASAGDVEDQLAQVLVDCVDSGASVGFLAPLSQDQARQWWRAALAQPDTLTWVARDQDDRIVGTVRLLPVAEPNGRHRAEVVKLLVHRDARGRGCASALMAALEAAARELGRSLLVLDTQTGSLAEGIYLRRGWQPVGTVADYAVTPDGQLAPTTFMTKRV